MSYFDIPCIKQDIDCTQIISINIENNRNLIIFDAFIDNISNLVVWLETALN